MTATGSTRSAPHGKGGGDGGEAGIPVSLFGGGVADLSADSFETSGFARLSEAMSQSCCTGSPSICAELRFLTTTGGCGRGVISLTWVGSPCSYSFNTRSTAWTTTAGEPNFDFRPSSRQAVSCAQASTTASSHLLYSSR